MLSLRRFIGDKSSLSREEFYELFARLRQMNESERDRFTSDPQNMALLERYDLYLDRFALRVQLPLTALVASSIVAGALLVG